MFLLRQQDFTKCNTETIGRHYIHCSKHYIIDSYHTFRCFGRISTDIGRHCLPIHCTEFIVELTWNNIHHLRRNPMVEECGPQLWPLHTPREPMGSPSCSTGLLFCSQSVDIKIMMSVKGFTSLLVDPIDRTNGLFDRWFDSQAIPVNWSHRLSTWKSGLLVRSQAIDGQRLWDDRRCSWNDIGFVRNISPNRMSHAIIPIGRRPRRPIDWNGLCDPVLHSGPPNRTHRNGTREAFPSALSQPLSSIYSYFTLHSQYG